ncbi:MAG: hypothetical protein Q4D65_01235 [Peptostreptococcaceae bacterium]|nr:hypothetical protein [Peptostreptococcaceae bacterium]
MRRKIFSFCLAGVLFLSSFSYADAQSGNLKRENTIRYTQLAKKKSKKKVSSKASAITKKQFYINGELAEIEVFTQRGTTMALARDLVDPLGAVLVVQPIEKNGKRINVVGFGKERYVIAFGVDSKQKIAAAITDGNSDNIIIKEAPVVATTRNGRTYVPLRYTVENLGGTLSAGSSSSQSNMQPNTSGSGGTIVSLPELKKSAPLVTGSGQTTQPVQPKKPVVSKMQKFRMENGNIPSPIIVDTSKIQKVKKNVSYNGKTAQLDTIEVNGDIMIGASDFEVLGLFYYFRASVDGTEYEGCVIGNYDNDRLAGFPLDFNMGFHGTAATDELENITIFVTPTKPIYLDGKYYVSVKAVSEGLGIQFQISR